ncbi:TIGR01777 family oxidoreductase [Dyadobacter arcticus]|uniref:TIGR01777 family protein n=1 Tax=Dyadobacter arcticus TaxID=1078754 RepID=A0ABX0UUT1_9BACT|nr:TIGR01777 family oxidoreductase [Dyadobacter arcticus]NIJ55535.1 hypothetical protein [Dyadobacter arcticus]
MGKKVLITGGTGSIGKRLTELLLKKGYEVAYLSRKKKAIPSVQVFEWDVEKGYLEQGALDNLHFLIHLAGAGVAEGRWTDKQKKIIISSRTDTITFLANQLKQKNILPAAFISASGSSYYGADSGNTRNTEASPPANDFLSHVTLEWEKAADLIKNQEVRTVKLRTGVVISKEGGAMPKIALPARFGFGAPLGSGKQWVPWIHMDDICQMYIDALENDFWDGAYNAVAPNPVTNEELTKQICIALDKPQWLPNVPAFALKLAFGEMASVVLGSSYLVNERIRKDTEFVYAFPNIKEAVKDVLQ